MDFIELFYKSISITSKIEVPMSDLLTSLLHLSISVRDQSPIELISLLTRQFSSVFLEQIQPVIQTLIEAFKSIPLIFIFLNQRL